MKKLVSVFMVVALLFALAACGNNSQDGESSLNANQSSASASSEETSGQSNPSELSPESEPEGKSAKSLVVYFSRSGNTENVAKAIQEQTGSDIFEIIPKTPYSDNHNTVVDLAQEEKKNEARPEISNSIENIEQYDVVYVGYPNWWGDMPMILYTFFDTYDLSGKTIAPFCTSGGSGLSDTVNEIKALEPDANVTNGLHIASGSAANPESAVSEWLSQINQK